MTETKLVEAAAKGDLESFGVLCEKYYPALVAIACSVLKDHHLAQDATQNSFAKAMVALPGLRNHKRFGPWLGRICRNMAMDMATGNKRHIAGMDISQIQAEQKSDDSTEAVTEAVAALKPGEREIIYLRYYNRMSYKQMTDILGLSKPAINGRLKRIKVKIADHLKQNGITEI